MIEDRLILKAKNLDEVYNSFTLSEGASEILDHPSLSDYDDANFGEEEDAWLEFLYRISEIDAKSVFYKGFVYKVINNYLYIYKQ